MTIPRGHAARLASRDEVIPILTSYPCEHNLSAQVPVLQDFIDLNPGAKVEFNFFLSPSTGEIGPDYGFASAISNAMVTHDIGFQIYNFDWWEYFQ